MRLVPISLATFRALDGGDLAEADRLLGLPVPEEFWAPVEIWAFMIGLLSERPENRDWVMSAMVADGVIVGNAGFKGAPDGGEVEIGYRISPAHRRRGLAVAAVGLLLDRARLDPDVSRVVARISPHNDASVRVATAAGLAPDGEWIHPRWGRQLVYAIDVAGPLTAGTTG